MLRRFLPLLFAITACSSSSSSGDKLPPPPGSNGCTEGTPGCIGWQACPPEMTSDPEIGCKEIVPASECAAGTMAVLGSATCAPVGPASCAAGFQKAKSGWGCEAIVPATACTGATRDALGSATCVPVGDCNAPFPPAAATYFVDASYADTQVDATHFKTIAAAITAAPAGATVAVEAGTYAEGIQTHGSVNVVGRCAEKVHLVGTGLEVWGLYAGGAQDVSLSGVTLQDHYEGVRAQKGARVMLSDVVIEAPRSSGLIAWQSGSKIHAERVVIRNTKPEPNKQTAAVMAANADGGATVELVDSSLTNLWEAGVVATNPTTPSVTSTILLQRSVIRDVNVVVHSLAGAGVVVSGASKGNVTESLILDVRRIGVASFDPGAALTVTSSVLQTTLEDTSGEQASGAWIGAGGRVDFVDSTLRDHSQVGIEAQGDAAVVTMTRGVVEATRPGDDGDFGMGAWADEGASLTLDTSALVGSSYYGVGAQDAKTAVKMTNVLVADTKTNKQQLFGRGVNLEFGATATLDKVTLARNADATLFVRGEQKGARAHATVTRLYVVDPVQSPADGRSGTGIAVEQGAILDLDTAAVARAKTAGFEMNDTPGDGGHIAEANLTHLSIHDMVGGQDSSPSTKSDVLSGVGMISGGKLTLHASAISGAIELAVAVSGASSESDIANVIVTGTTPGKQTGVYGHGIVGMTAASIIVRDSIVRGNQIGLAFESTPAIVSDVLVQSNAVGIHVQGDGFTLQAADAAPDSPQPNTVVVTNDSQFIDDQTRVGSGQVVLPSDPLPATGAAAKKKPSGGL